MMRPSFPDLCSPTWVKGASTKEALLSDTDAGVGYVWAWIEVYGNGTRSAQALGQNTTLRATGRGDQTGSWAGLGFHVPLGDDHLLLSLHLPLLWHVPSPPAPPHLPGASHPP